MLEAVNIAKSTEQTFPSENQMNLTNCAGGRENYKLIWSPTITSYFRALATNQRGKPNLNNEHRTTYGLECAMNA